MKKPVVCFFGTYDKTYTSNRLVLAGLRANGVTVYEVNAAIKVTTLTKKSEMTFGMLLMRTLKKYRLLSEVIKHHKEIQKRGRGVALGQPQQLRRDARTARQGHRRYQARKLVAILADRARAVFGATTFTCVFCLVPQPTG